MTSIATARVMPVKLMKAGPRVGGFSKLLVVPSGAGPAATWQRSIDMMTDGGRQMIRKRKLLKQGGEHQSDDDVGWSKR